MKEVILFENVTKSYILYHHFMSFKNFLFRLPKVWKAIQKERFYALKNVSFSVYQGEAIGFIGPNGAGKSTVLSMIAGVLYPDSGKVKIEGKVSPLLELGTGFHPELSGLENIFLNGVLLGMRIKEIEKKISSIIEFSELGNFIDQPIRTYSSGMLARLGFSIAVHIEPEILLIDEVLGVGDAHFQKKSFEKILEFKEMGKTIVFVSHDLHSVETLCDRLIWLEQGTIVKEGKEVAEIIEEYRSKMFAPV